VSLEFLRGCFVIIEDQGELIGYFPKWDNLDRKKLRDFADRLHEKCKQDYDKVEIDQKFTFDKEKI
jgi:hypothetical protein